MRLTIKTSLVWVIPSKSCIRYLWVYGKLIFIIYRWLYIFMVQEQMVTNIHTIYDHNICYSNYYKVFCSKKQELVTCSPWSWRQTQPWLWLSLPGSLLPSSWFLPQSELLVSRLMIPDENMRQFSRDKPKHRVMDYKDPMYYYLTYLNSIQGPFIGNIFQTTTWHSVLTRKSFLSWDGTKRKVLSFYLYSNTKL